MNTCDICSAKVSELRRGRCWGCYSRWVEARPVGAGAKCVTCVERRRRVLKSVELHGSWHPMCFSCSGQLLTLDVVPPTIAELKVAISRERRKKERRYGRTDSRVFQYERRVGQRRLIRTPNGDVQIEDDMILEVSTVNSGSVEIDFEDMTQIRDRFEFNVG